MIDNRQTITLHVNGAAHTLAVEPRWTLARVLREDLGLTGTQIGCDRAECGACAVHLDGRAAYACTTLAVQAEGRAITTIEGLSPAPAAGGEMRLADLDPLQRAFVEHDALQCGFCTPGFIMSARALLNQKPKPTMDDIRFGLIGNICRCGAYPKIIAAVLDASDQPELARAAERVTRHAATELPPLEVLGAYVPRNEAIDKVIGRADFVSSLRLPGMAHAKVLRSPHAHARIVQIDTSRAEQAPGVLCVLTHRDMPAALWTPPDAHILDDRVRYIGDEVAAVVAETEDKAADALALITVEYELLPAVFDERALSADAAPIHEGGNTAGTMNIARGDPDAGFAEADVVIEDTFHFAPVHSSPLQARVAVAHWEGDQLTVWAASRSPFLLKQRLSQVFGLPREAVRVLVNVTGGSYGSKDESRVTFLAAALARKAGRPVRLWFTRFEEMTAGRNRPWGRIHIKAGVKRDGTLTAITSESLFNSGAYSGGGFSIGRGAGAIFDMYRCAARYGGTMHYSNLPPAGSYRALNAVHSTFAVESIIDRLAEAVQIDPLEFRRKNCVRPGDLLTQVDGRPVPPLPLSTSGYEECLWLGAEQIGWSARNAQPGAGSGRRLRGIGFAPVVYGTGSDESDAEVEILPDGHVGVLSGVSDVGVGTRTVLAMIAAEVLGVPYAAVGIRSGDTNLPNAPMQAGSRITFTVGWATKLAAESARAQLLKLAEPLFEVAAADLRIERGVIKPKDGGTGHTFAEVFTFAGRGTPINGLGHSTQQAKPAVQGFGAHFAEVDVDLDTGDVRVLRYVAAHDVGRALNPHGVENQIYGLAQTLGQALSEELVFDHGLTLNANLSQYLMPTLGDFPPVDVVMVETNEPLGPFGAKGIGEPPLPPVAPAIANAIYNAVGVRFNSLPIARDAVLAALAAKEAAR
ncbi:MAG: molybdopterin-dependent oxidoreductase [Chloroflexi bacterium]|nr:molybdopterin-dependent oxidoreductase [Chloroflexota bacterium]